MKKIVLLKLIVFASVLMLLPFLNSCFKDQVVYQRIIQDALLKPNKEGKCWVLGYQQDSVVYEYYLKYYQFQSKGIQSNGEDWIYYSSPTEVKRKLRYDFIDERIIDNDIQDCTESLDVLEAAHTYFKTSDYPLFGSKHRENYAFSTRKFAIKEFSAAKPSIRDTSFYYYEELYFEDDGTFRKKIFLDTNCVSFTITGNWKFRTPFANKDAYYSDGRTLTTDIILDYDNAPVVGVPPKGNIYTLTMDDANKALTLKQVDVETDSTFLGVRRNYTVSTDYIQHSPNINAIVAGYTPSFISGHQRATPYDGMVKNHWAKNCNTFDGNGGNDKIEVYDPLNLQIVKQTGKIAVYYLDWPRCTGHTSSNNCPKYCQLDICGTFRASVYDSDNKNLLSSHESVLSITTDSTILTITNFANMGQAVDIEMPSYCWFSCYNYQGFDKTINGKRVILSSFNVQTFNGKRMIYAEYSVAGTSYIIHYEPK